MKTKLLILLGMLLLFPFHVYAQAPVDYLPERCGDLANLRIVLGGGVAAAPSGDTEETCTGDCLLSCSWSATGAVNTDGGTGHVWDSESGAGTLSKVDSSGAGYNGVQDEYLDIDGTGLNYLVYDFTNDDNIGGRFAIYVAADENDASNLILQVKDSSIFYPIKIFFNGSTSAIKFESIYNGGTDTLSSSALTLQQWYIVYFKAQRNAAGSCFRVYDCTAADWLDAEQCAANAIRDNAFSYIFLGMQTSTFTVDMRIDALYLHGLTSYPSAP